MHWHSKPEKSPTFNLIPFRKRTTILRIATDVEIKIERNLQQNRQS
jgi:hypothetical protein